MKRSDFHFELPSELIAQYPLARRSESRLLHYNRGSSQIDDLSFPEIKSLLEPGDLLVFNNTRVIPARLYGHKQTGGKIEVLIERLMDESRFLAHIKSSKAPKTNSILSFDANYQCQVLGRREDLFECQMIGATPALTMLYDIGHIPLPPYIEREDNVNDQSRYQTVYAAVDGAVAAPTAGLHFDEGLLEELANLGIQSTYVTLHVGAGTFQPVRVNNISEHNMHSEFIEVTHDACQAIKAAKTAGKKVIAVGTTAVRCLETAGAKGEIKPFSGDTNIFIYPGHTFQIIDGLITNFHLPESTLIMLISALMGTSEVLRAYQHAIEQRYRFFSYGDAMFIL